jgi:transcriptional regulator with XRE-family HTH domain
MPQLRREPSRLSEVSPSVLHSGASQSGDRNQSFRASALNSIEVPLIRFAARERAKSSARHVGEIIRSARNRLELTEEFCAQKCGLSSAHYYDLEAYGDEFAANMSLGTARRICNLLGLDLLDLTATFSGVQISQTSIRRRRSFLLPPRFGTEHAAEKEIERGRSGQRHRLRYNDDPASRADARLHREPAD